MSVFSICGGVLNNTRGIDCDVTRGNPTMIIPGSAIFAPSAYASTATFQTNFQAKIKQSSTAIDKLFPFPVIQGTTDQTEAAKYGNSGYGLKVKLLRSKQAYEFQVLAGSTLEKKLIAADGKIIPLFIFDDQDNLWGKKDTSLNFSGVNYLVGVEPRGFGDAQNAKFTTITISIVDAADFTENAAVADTSFSSSDLQGQLDAILSEVAAHSTNVYKIGAKVPTVVLGQSVDIHAIAAYASTLASSSMWVAKTGATFGTTMTITSVVDDPTDGGWTVTLDSTAYTALASGAQIKLNLVDVATLDAAGVTGIEGTYLILTKP